MPHISKRAAIIQMVVSPSLCIFFFFILVFVYKCAIIGRKNTFFSIADQIKQKIITFAPQIIKQIATLRTISTTRKPFQPDRVETFRIDTETTLLPFLLQVLAPRSRNSIKSMMKYGHVRVGGRIVRIFDTPLAPGDEMEVNLVRPFPMLRSPMMSILYEDDALIVVEKKSGLLSVGVGDPPKENAWHIVTEYLRQSKPFARSYVVHRLDQYTSGILIFAKTEDVQKRFRSAWSSYVVDRRYVAITEHVPAEREGEIATYLAQSSAMKVYSTDNPDEGKLAVTRYRVMRVSHDRAIVDVQLLTGRKNQIRVHLSEMGCPIVGDRKYGAVSNPHGRLMLHNYKLQFVHPLTKENLVFELPYPPCFRI